MESSGIFMMFILVAICAAFIRLMAGSTDKTRVRNYIESQGGRMLDSQWSPFGKGWMGEKDARIYRVQFEDRFGNIREATVKTSMFSGVYFTEDIIVMPAASEREQAAAPVATTSSNDAAELADLRAENERLKAELARSRNTPQPLFQTETDEPQ